MKQQSINQENEKEFFTKKAAEIASLKKAGMEEAAEALSLIHISEPTRLHETSRMPSSA